MKATLAARQRSSSVAGAILADSRVAATPSFVSALFAFCGHCARCSTRAPTWLRRCGKPRYRGTVCAYMALRRRAGSFIKDAAGRQNSTAHLHLSDYGSLFHVRSCVAAPLGAAGVWMTGMSTRGMGNGACGRLTPGTAVQGQRLPVFLRISISVSSKQVFA